MCAKTSAMLPMVLVRCRGDTGVIRLIRNAGIVECGGAVSDLLSGHSETFIRISLEKLGLVYHNGKKDDR